jgi:hypothetical protein
MANSFISPPVHSVIKATHSLNLSTFTGKSITGRSGSVSMCVNCTVSAGNVNFSRHEDEIALMFVSDVMFMSPEGAVLVRPASTVRAVECVESPGEWQN